MSHIPSDWQSVQSILARHDAILLDPPHMVPTPDYPDGPILGNGDLGCVVGGPPENQTFYLSKNDFWTDGTGWQTNEPYSGYVVSPIVIGGVTVASTELIGASYHQDLALSSAILTSTFRKENAGLKMVSRVDANLNLLSLALKNTGNEPLKITLCLWAKKSDDPDAILPTEASCDGETAFVTRSTWDRGRWVSRAAILLDGLTAAEAPQVTDAAVKVEISLAPGGSRDLMAYCDGGMDAKEPVAQARQTLEKLHAQPAGLALQQHSKWWENFWMLAWLDLGGGTLERFWYGSQYLLACTNRAGKTAPGLFGPATSDHPRWNGDYHLNYNFEQPYQGLYSSNRQDFAHPYYQAILDFLPESLRRASEDLDPAQKGAYYPVGIGPAGIVVADDYMSQKSCSVFAAVNFLSHALHTLDPDFLSRTAAPLLYAVADFWTGFLKHEHGRWHIEGSAAHEHGDHFRNSTWDLALVKHFFKSLIKLIPLLSPDAQTASVWKDIADNLAEYPASEFDGYPVLVESEDCGRFSRTHSLYTAFWPGSGDFVIGGQSENRTLGFHTLRLLELWDQGNSFVWAYMAAVRTGYPHIMNRLEEHLADTRMRYWMKEGDPRNPDRYFGAGWCRGIRPNLTVWHTLGGLETAGGTAIINESLLQSHEGFLRLFPVWDLNRDAKFVNLRTEGAFLVQCAFTAGKIDQLMITSERGGKLAIWCSARSEDFHALEIASSKKQEPAWSDGPPAGGVVAIFQTRPNEIWEFVSANILLPT